MNAQIAAVLIIALALWAIASAAVVVAGKGDSDGMKYYSYATFGVAPIVAIVAVYLVLKGDK